MIVMTRDLARRFRAVAKKCVPARGRWPASPATCRAAGGTLTVTAKFGDVVLGVTAPAPPGPDATLVVPADLLDAVGGVGPDPLELRPATGRKGLARFADRGVPREVAFAAGKEDETTAVPPVPAEFSPPLPGLTAALHECGRTAGVHTRYDLDRVQVRGRAGQVVGSDGRTVLIAGGFAFPFADDLLLPAVPAFGCRELAAGGDARAGVADGRLVVRLGPWTVWLASNPGGRYPDAAAVVPKALDPSVLGLDDRDAAVALDALAHLPDSDGDCPVTLDLGDAPAVRARGTAGVVEVRLSRSPTAGPPVRVAVDRKALRRAVALGCRTVRVAAADRPVVFEAPGRTFVASALDKSAVVGPDDDVRGESNDTETDTTTAATIRTKRSFPMKSETNGRNGHGPADPPAADAPDPLAEAEALRAALTEAATRAARLVAVLRTRRREKKALETVLSGLKTLNLGV